MTAWKKTFEAVIDEICLSPRPLGVPIRFSIAGERGSNQTEIISEEIHVIF